MRKKDWLQSVLYLSMAVLAIYIIFKGGSIWLGSNSAQRRMSDGSLQRPIEDAAMRTLVPGYTAVVEERQGENWMSDWMKPVIPVYSYLAEEQGISEDEPEIETGSETEGMTGISKADAPEERDIGSNKKAEETESVTAEVVSNRISPALRQQLNDFDYLISNYYTVDGGTAADEVLFDTEKLLSMDLSLLQNPKAPQILIYHTHSQEAFVDSREGMTEDTIVGMGEVLAKHLRGYGYQVIHDTGTYDLVDGVLDRSAAYDYAREAVEQILKKYPTIEVIVDLHRDGVDGTKFVTEIGGKPTAKIMFFNGLSRDAQMQELSWLPNENLIDNLAFSLQMELLARELYPDFTRNIYLKAERFNLHLRPRSLLIEAGTQLNTVEEERNAMEPLAELIYQVLSGVKQ